MKPLGFEDLARLAVVQFYETAFRKATGISLRLIPPDCDPLRDIRPRGNDFCEQISSTTAGCQACQDAEQRAQRGAAATQTTRQVYCYAGMTVLAAPVIVAGRHVATLLAGQILRREPTERDFQMVVKMVEKDLSTDWVRKARKAYFETPVLSAERFEAAIQLLDVFAQYLADVASRQAIASAETDPKPVATAKEFVRAHVDEAITLDQVVRHVNVSRFYFCKLFKKATGLTLTEYVARVRIEKAKELLSDPNSRISEVVFASGFGSIPRFNTVFKQHVGMPPTEYRATLRGAPAGLPVRG
ncbi:MAG TPA: PocR ligand-binding domain-containing protein [Verrucomicrobiae bacterium]|nr:PocR ligand-binding domain-containing protein [Verrucomicrobiae bacterium]